MAKEQLNQIQQALKDAQETFRHFAALVEKEHPDWAHTARAWAKGAEDWILLAK